VVQIDHVVTSTREETFPPIDNIVAIAGSAPKESTNFIVYIIRRSKETSGHAHSVCGEKSHTLGFPCRE
jgi:hypothetical protein